MKDIRKIQLAGPLLLCASFSFGADLIAISSGKPVAELSSELQKRYGYLVTYEEAPYSDQELTSEPRPGGKKFLFPRSAPMVFHVERPAPDTLTVINRLLEAHNRSGNPQRFTAIHEGEYVHIIPTSRNVNGQMEPFLPMLSTMVSFTPEARLCQDVLTDLLGQVGRDRGIAIVPSITPANHLMTHDCSIQGGSLSARSVLSQILTQILPSNYPSDLAKGKFAWSLLYESNYGRYFLAIKPVFQGQSGSLPEQAEKPATSVATETGDSAKTDVANPQSGMSSRKVKAPVTN